MTTPHASLEVLSTEESAYLASPIAKQLGANHRHVVRRLFSNGERYYKIDIKHNHELIHKDVIFIGSTHSDDDLLELYRVGSALADLGTRRRIFVIPYFGYSTMERADNAGEIVTAKMNARLLSTIPNTNLGNVFIFLDLHKAGILHYFEGDNVTVELSAQDILVGAIKKLRIRNGVIASTDLGTPKRIQSLAAACKADIAFISKTRDFETTHVVSVVGNVKNKDVVIYDDMIRSGSSLIQAAKAYKKQGARHIYAATSHLALPNKNVINALKTSPLEKIITTNSHPATQSFISKRDSFFTVLDIAKLTSNTIKTILR